MESYQVLWLNSDCGLSIWNPYGLHANHVLLKKLGFDSLIFVMIMQHK